VTSPGGTSAAALYYLEKAGFRTAISRAVWAAYERAQQLGKDQNSSVPE
jgi:pyrroline-5-carboxylate reductase